MSALGALKGVVRGLFKLGLIPVVFGGTLIAANLALGAALGAAEGAGLAAAAGVTYRQSLLLAGVIATIVTGWFAS